MYYRQIFYLEFRFGPVDMCVIALGRDGRSASGNSNGHPRPPVKLTIDLRPGDQVMSDGTWWTIESVRAWRDHWLTEDQARRHGDGGHGYFYCPKRQPVELLTRVLVGGVERWLVKYAERAKVI